jgi:hypothetical protein
MAVDAGAVAQACEEPGQIPERVREARLAALKTWVAAYRS